MACTECNPDAWTSEVQRIQALSTTKKVIIGFGCLCGILPGLFLYLIWRPNAK